MQMIAQEGDKIGKKRQHNIGYAGNGHQTLILTSKAVSATANLCLEG